MAPRLTIAIPTLNRAQLLTRAIESALAQTSPDIEIIVSDNGSTDDTPAVIDSPYASIPSLKDAIYARGLAGTSSGPSAKTSKAGEH
jgi:glycosyltransferase involved in cell wall biosynthesis